MMAASDHLSPQFANQVEYTPRSYTHLDILKGANGPIVSPLHYTNPATGFDEINHVVEAHHPEHGMVGHAKWSDRYGNITVEVQPQYRNRGIGSRLVDEAYKHDPENALRDLTPVTHAGQALAEKTLRKYPGVATS